MLLYYTHLHAKDNLTLQELIDMFIYWMQNTKNKIKNLNYDHTFNYICKDEHKKFEIKDFHDKGILGIQFITNQNYKKNQFTVEVLYSYQNQTIDLAFYKDIANDSKYIPKLSIPKIFFDILKNDKVLHDHHLKIQERPHFIYKNTLKQILLNHYDLPLILLYRKEKCCINPFILNADIYGMAHVLVVKSQTDQNTIEIIYPSGEKEKLLYTHTMQQEVFHHIRNYMVQENQFYSFDELKRFELIQTYQENTMSSYEFQEYFLEEIKSMKSEIDKLEQIYENIKTQYDILLTKNNEYKQLMSQYNDDMLISINKDNYKDYQKLVISIIDKNLKNFVPGKVYRKKDILESMKRKQKQ